MSYQQSRKSTKDYYAWRRQRIQPVVDKLASYVDLKNSRVLEIGCGYGAFVAALNDLGAQVTGTEIDKESLQIAKKMLAGRKGVRLIQVKDENLPFRKDSFDLLVLFDVIEHINNPQKMIAECSRVMRPGSVIYFEFTPYYSLTGHHLYDITKLPIHILPETIIKKIIYRSKPKGIFTHRDYWLNFKTLNKLKITDFQKYVSSFKKQEEKFVFKYPEVFELNLPFLNYLGPFKDLFTLSFEGIYRKPDSKE